MIARFRILLPYRMLVTSGDAPKVIEEIRDGYQVRIPPPYRARLDMAALDMDSNVPVSNLPRDLLPADPQPLSETNRMDGHPVIAANVLQIDVVADSFNRTPGTDDPPTELAFAAANKLLLALRHLARAQQIRPVSARSTLWLMTYLHDDESEVVAEEGFYRQRVGVSWSVSYLGLGSNLWDAAAAVPATYTPAPSSTLLLDASALASEIGPAILLAASAIETRIDSALKLLAETSDLNPEFWRWLTERGGQYHKEPSFTEKLDPLLRGVAGASLKDDATLWRAFQDIRKARNSFAHEGVARIGALDVTQEKALELIANAALIVDWIEALLPPEDRRFTLEAWTTIETTRLLFASETSSGGGDGD
jgi:hypothetical protein